MGLEFMPIFTDWADTYDEEIENRDSEYKDVFVNYEQVLDKIVELSGFNILEFGSGTGNLTEKLMEKSKIVYPVEPSKEMIQIFKTKENLKDVQVYDGDMENFPLPSEDIDTIVSNLVFHHLSSEEKESAIAKYASILPLGAKIVFGDTMFLSRDSLEYIVTREREKGALELVEDLQREYYSIIPQIDLFFKKHGFDTRYTQMNEYIWILEAVKIA